MRRIYDYRGLIVAVCTVAIIVCFFLPWIKVHIDAVAAVKGLVGGERSASMLTISGAGVPQLANGASAKTLIKVFGLFFGSVENVDKKSYLIWIVPLLTMIIMAVSLKFKGRWIVSLALSLLCGAISIGVTCKLILTDLNGLLVSVQVCWAFWALLVAFAVISLAHFISIPVERRLKSEDGVEQSPAGAGKLAAPEE